MAGRDMTAPLRRSQDVLKLDFPGVSRPVLLDDAPEILTGLMQAIRGWLPRVGHAGAAHQAAPPLVTVTRQGMLHTVASDFLDSPMSRLPTASAVCGVIADLVQSYFEERPGGVVLHAGGFVIGGRLVAVTGEAKAGKSTLMSRLTAEPEVEVFGDDVLPILEGDTGIGLGVAPRLRLPLPATASAFFREHVARNMGLHDDRYAYLRPERVAPHGSTAPLRVLVVLTRRPDGPAQLHHLPRPEAVAQILARNMATLGEGPAGFDRVTRLAEGLLCLRLVYSDLDDAATLLRRALGGAVLPDPAVAIAPPLVQGAEPENHARMPSPVHPMQAWRRADGTGVRRVGTSLYLWQPATQGYFHLNAVAGAVWTLLETPQSSDMLADCLAEVFPEAGKPRIAADTASLLGGFADAGLILPHDHAAAGDGEGRELVESIGIEPTTSSLRTTRSPN